MARAGKQWVPLDVNHADELVHLSPMARYADIVLMCLAKRLMSDGRLSEAQARSEIAYRIGGDIAPILAELRGDGLWTSDDGTLTRHGWGRWNDTAAEVEVMSKGGSKGNHLRWHVKRGRVDPDCSLCTAAEIGGRSGTESGGDRGPNRRVDIDIDVDGEIPSGDLHDQTVHSPRARAGDDAIKHMSDVLARAGASSK